MDNNIKELISPVYTEPTFFVNFYKLVRPSAQASADSFTHTILKTNNLACWKIHEEQLVKPTQPAGIFFDEESYLVQWLFDLKVDNTILEELLVYYWKGQNAIKGFTPLPPEIEEHCPVERIVQGSEPAIFFHAYPQGFFVFSGLSTNFDNQKPHLLMLRGELPEEQHFYEVPCERRALRSRAVFLLIHPEQESFIIWQGKSIQLEFNTNCLKGLKNWQNEWAQFSVHTVHEGSESQVFLDALKDGDYCSIEQKQPFSPKLFYLNSISGQFEATPVEYPLRAEGVEAAFPFLQSHFYTATQPALFLLDNYTEVFLWEGDRRCLEGCNMETFEEEVGLARKLAEDYIAEKEKILEQKVHFYQVYAEKEPLEFQNLFPEWN